MEMKKRAVVCQALRCYEMGSGLLLLHTYTVPHTEGHWPEVGTLSSAEI